MSTLLVIGVAVVIYIGKRCISCFMSVFIVAPSKSSFHVPTLNGVIDLVSDNPVMGDLELDE